MARGMRVALVTIAAVCSGVLPGSSAAWATDHGIGGLKLQIRARGSARKLVFVSKDPSALFPAIGSTDDPAGGTPGGATVDVVTPDAVATLAIPSGAAWKAKDRTLDSYVYKNPLAPAGPSAVRSLALRQGRTLKVSARDLPLPLTAALGTVGIRITTGSLRSCALFDASSVVTDVPGTFDARGAFLAIPADCSDFALGLASVCGNGIAEHGEACDGASDAACPGHCAADCTCNPFCGDGNLDAGEQCDGTAFGTSPDACFRQPGLAEPACTSDCTCCATLVCSGDFFQLPCCPGYVCPQRLGPHDYTFCRKACQATTECNAGDFCFGGQCRTPNCSSDAQCSGGVCLGVCCYDVPNFGFVCP